MLRHALLPILSAALLAATTTAQQCDLRVTSLSTTSTTLTAGAPLQVRFVVENDSAVNCPKATNASLRLSGDTVFSGDDLKLADVVVPALLARSSKQYVLDLRVPWSVHGGTAALVVRVDASAQVNEGIEINNDRALVRNAKAWFGSPRIEYRPVLEQSVGLESNAVSTEKGTRLRMALIAPDKHKHWYLLRMSGQRNFAIDVWTVFGLELLNSAFQPRWFAQMQQVQAFPDYWMPSNVPFFGRVEIYVSALFVDPGFQHFTGDTANSVRLVIQR